MDLFIGFSQNKYVNLQRAWLRLVILFIGLSSYYFHTDSNRRLCFTHIVSI